MIAAGKLNHRVTLQQPGGVPDAVGERATTWSNIATVWASVAPLSTTQLAAAAQMQTNASIRVTVRWSPAIAAIAADWRVLFGSRILVIAAPPRNVAESNEMIELLCSEGLREE
jgi:SPP1 family predicted phage head-tail adaptor